MLAFLPRPSIRVSWLIRRKALYAFYDHFINSPDKKNREMEGGFATYFMVRKVLILSSYPHP
mgnify:CR=1 FL=1